jgi:hypothetical protein
LPFTVTTGIELDEPKEPVLEFTVASVKADVPAVAVASPVNAGSLAAGKVPLAILVALTKFQDVAVPSVVKNLPELPV